MLGLSRAGCGQGFIALRPAGTPTERSGCCRIHDAVMDRMVFNVYTDHSFLKEMSFDIKAD